MFALVDFKVGQRIRVHPASDWFMRGVSYATVTKIGLFTLTLVCDRTGTRFRLAPSHVLEIVE